MGSTQVYLDEYNSCMSWGSTTSSDYSDYAECVDQHTISMPVNIYDCTQGNCVPSAQYVDPGVEYACWQSTIPVVNTPPVYPSFPEHPSDPRPPTSTDPPTQQPPCDPYYDCKVSNSKSRCTLL